MTFQGDLSSATSHVDSHVADLEGLLRSLVRFRTENPPGHVGKLVDFVEEYASGLGLETRRVVPTVDYAVDYCRRRGVELLEFFEDRGIHVEEFCQERGVSEKMFERDPHALLDEVLPDGLSNHPTLFLSARRGSSGKKLTFVVHSDVVPAGDLEKWGGMDPFDLTAREGVDGEVRYFGRGVADTKGSLAAVLFALRALVETGAEWEGEVEVVLTPDEETASVLGIKYLVGRGMISGDAVVVCEPTVGLGGMVLVALGERGHVSVTLRASGKSAHESMKFLGESAIEKLTAVVERLLDLEKERLEISGPLKDLVERSIQAFSPRLASRREMEDIYTRTRVNVGVFHGGSKVNVVPDEAEVDVGFRTMPGTTTDDVVAKVKDVLRSTKFDRVRPRRARKVKIVEVSDLPASFLPNAGEIFEVVRRAAKDAWGVEDVPGILYPGATDACWIRSPERPTIVFGLGAGNVHSEMENVLKRDFVNATKVYARVVMDFLSK
ncbi:MAG: hypothetical protein Kow0069_36550 [Promethearchaeota archaeon]